MIGQRVAPVQSSRGQLVPGDTALLILLAATVSTTLSCDVLMMRPPRRISGYRGDGTVSRIKNPVNPGWKVDFDPFSLARAFAGRYTLDDLPKTWWRNGYEARLVVALTPTEEP